MQSSEYSKVTSSKSRTKWRWSQYQYYHQIPNRMNVMHQGGFWYLPQVSASQTMDRWWHSDLHVVSPSWYMMCKTNSFLVETISLDLAEKERRGLRRVQPERQARCFDSSLLSLHVSLPLLQLVNCFVPLKLTLFENFEPKQNTSISVTS